MNRRQFLMSTLASFALTALPKLTLAETIPVSQSVKDKVNPKNKLGFGFMRLPLKHGAEHSHFLTPADGKKLSAVWNNTPMKSRAARSWRAARRFCAVCKD